MGFGSADLTYLLPKNICFKLIKIVSTLEEGEGQGWGTKSLRVQSLNDHMDMSSGERLRSFYSSLGPSAEWVLSKKPK